MTDRTIHRDALPPGTRVREFELLDVLGRGGFGITYLGRNNLNIQVAIKEYMPLAFAVRDGDGNVCPRTDGQHGDYEWGLEKFLDEARLLARFEREPNIVQVRQFFEANDTAYMVMEFLNGRTLYDELEAEGTLSEERLRDLLTPILTGLKQVHAAGAWHMDIKPGNIVLRDDVTPVLIDFGAAEIAVAEHSRLVQSVVMPGFSPSEQYSNSTRHHGPWTDIYALGAVLYRGMTGSVPIDGLLRVHSDELVPVGTAAKRRYSPALVEAVDWALRVNATDRPQSIDEWRKALEGGRRSRRPLRPRKHVPEPEPAPRPRPRPPTPPEPERSPRPVPGPAPEPERPPRPAPRTPPEPERGSERREVPERPTWPLVVAGFAAIAIVLGLGWLAIERPEPPPPPPPPPLPDSSPKPPVRPTIPREGAAALAEAKEARSRGELTLAQEKLETARGLGLPEGDYRTESREIEKAEETLRECEAHWNDKRYAEAESCYARLLRESTPRYGEAQYQVLYTGMAAAVREVNQSELQHGLDSAETRAAIQRNIDKLTSRMDEYRRVDLERGTELENAARDVINHLRRKLDEQ